MIISLPSLKILTESQVRRIFREELREYLTVFNESIESHNKSMTKTLELIHAKLDGKEHTTLSYVSGAQDVVRIDP